MIWNSWSEFFAMGGYAFYVWSSFLMCVALLCWEVLLLRSERRAALALARTLCSDSKAH